MKNQRPVTDHDNYLVGIFAGRQVPIFSYNFYFSQQTPIFPIFQQFPPNFSHFLAILHLTFLLCISFQEFLFNFSFFLSVAHQLFLKKIQVSLHLALFHSHIIKKNYLDFCIWPLWIGMAVGVLGDAKTM